MNPSLKHNTFVHTHTHTHTRTLAHAHTHASTHTHLPIKYYTICNEFGANMWYRCYINNQR